MTKKYNINELLEKKKYLERQLVEKTGVQQEKDLSYVEEKTIDRKNPDNNRKTVPKAKVELTGYTNVAYGLIDELAKVKEAIQKFNSGEVLSLLQKRTAVRNKLSYLNNIKAALPRDRNSSRQVLSEDSEGNPVEIKETVVEPMFGYEVVEKHLNELSAEERKLNSEIQKLNLNAEITL